METKTLGATIAAGLALVALGVGLAVDSARKDDAPPVEKKLEVREFKREGGETFFGYYADEKKESIVEAPPQCVIPDCKGGEGPVDCLRQQPTDDKPKWKGCNAMPVEESSGSECIPTGCWKYFGEE